MEVNHMSSELEAKAMIRPSEDNDIVTAREEPNCELRGDDRKLEAGYVPAWDGQPAPRCKRPTSAKAL